MMWMRRVGETEVVVEMDMDMETHDSAGREVLPHGFQVDYM